MDFDIVIIPKIPTVIASGHGIRNLKDLKESYGGKNWKKVKGICTIRLINGSLAQAEIHWYVCHGVGNIGFVFKRLV